MADLKNHRTQSLRTLSSHPEGVQFLHEQSDLDLESGAVNGPDRATDRPAEHELYTDNYYSNIIINNSNINNSNPYTHIYYHLTHIPT